MKTNLICILGSFFLVSCVMVMSGCDKDKGDEVTTVEDVDGNIYNTTRIGSQVWMTTELKTTKFCDGSPIPNVTDNFEWDNTDAPAYCWYKNDPGSFEFPLYNWYAVDTKKLCPEGWHVPTIADWTVLANFLGGWEIAGGYLKEKGNANWRTENQKDDDKYGFSAKPTRRRETGVGFLVNTGDEGGWWSSEVDDSDPLNKGDARYLRHESYELKNGGLLFNDGICVRCIQD